MRASAIKTNYQGCPSSILVLGFSAESETNITLNKEYSVWALSRWRGVPFFQIINDINFPVWLPSWLFNLTDKSVPAGWVFNFYEDEIEVLLGPDFIAQDQDAYQSMVEMIPSSVEAFWRNVKMSEENNAST